MCVQINLTYEYDWEIVVNHLANYVLEMIDHKIFQENMFISLTRLP